MSMSASQNSQVVPPVSCEESDLGSFEKVDQEPRLPQTVSLDREWERGDCRSLKDRRMGKGKKKVPRGLEGEGGIKKGVLRN